MIRDRVIGKRCPTLHTGCRVGLRDVRDGSARRRNRWREVSFADVPVTDAEIKLVVAMLGGADGIRCKLAEFGINQAEGDAAAVASRRHRRKRRAQQSGRVMRVSGQDDVGIARRTADLRESVRYDNSHQTRRSD